VYPRNVTFNIRILYSFPTRRSSNLGPQKLQRCGMLNQNTHAGISSLFSDAVKGKLFRLYSQSGANLFSGYSQLLIARNTRVRVRSEEHTSEIQSHLNLVCRLMFV